MNETVPENLYEIDITESSLPSSTNKITTTSPPKAKVKFIPSSIHEDLSQILLPVIDTRKISPRKKLPLSGIGTKHVKGRGSGGRIAPMLFSYDLLSLFYMYQKSTNEKSIRSG